MTQIALFNTEKLEKDILEFINAYVKMKFDSKFMPERERAEVFDCFQETYTDLLKVEDLRDVKDKLKISGEKLDFFMEKMKCINDEIEEHNDRFMEFEMDLEKFYLDDILKNIDPEIVLDTEQRRVVLNDSDASLVVAGAGAGKTTTMAAKVKYLVEKQNINPDEIIVISFTRKAVKELKDKIQNQLGIPAKVITFHSFGNEIIRNNSEDYPEVETYKRKYFVDILKNRIYENRII